MIANFSPFPILETPRLILRSLSFDDIESIFEMRSNPKMIEFKDGVVDKSLEDSHTYIEKMLKGVSLNEWIIWGIELKEEKKVIGTISIWNLNEEENKAELGYGLNPKYWHQGYMNETIKKVLEYGFNEMKLDLIEAYTEEKNLRSRQLLEKLEFKLNGKIEEEGYFKKEVYTFVIYQKERE